MKTFNYKVVFVLLIFTGLFPQWSYAAGETELTPAMVNPGHEEVPDWFKVSFLDLHDDVAEAAENGRRLMLFFFQDGCPYCKKLLEDNFGQRTIAEKTQKYFDVVTINIWGDREVTVGDKVFTEKQFSEALKVQYTPTLMLFNEKNKVVYRANGYYPPEKFITVLDYVGMRKEKELSYQDYIAKIDPKPASGKLHTEVINVSNPYDLSKMLETGKHLLVMFEQKQCQTCDELHEEVMNSSEAKEFLNKFNVSLVDMWSKKEIVRPDGKKSKISDWAKDLDIKYAPSLVYFNDKGIEVFRSDAYLKSFHVLSVMDYISSEAYKEQTNFQRYIDTRADHIREQGGEVNLMK